MMTVVMRFPGERLGTFTLSYGANPMGQYRIVGTEGRPGSNARLHVHGPVMTHQLTVGEKKSTRRASSHHDQFGGETKYFSDCVLDDKHPEPDGEEGLADVRVIKAIEKSLETGLPQKAGGVHAPAAADARADHQAQSR